MRQNPSLLPSAEAFSWRRGLAGLKRNRVVFETGKAAILTARGTGGRQVWRID
jgi:hypothetical protein